MVDTEFQRLHASEEDGTDGCVGHGVDVVRGAVSWSLVWRSILFFLEDCTELLSSEKNGPHTSMAVHTVTPALSVRGGGRRVTNSRPVCPKLNRKRGI